MHLVRKSIGSRAPRYRLVALTGRDIDNMGFETGRHPTRIEKTGIAWPTRVRLSGQTALGIRSQAARRSAQDAIFVTLNDFPNAFAAYRITLLKTASTSRYDQSAS